MPDRKHYQAKKRIADRVAFWLSGVLSMLGIGLICGIAIMAILPAMPLAAFIPTLVAFSLLGGYVESFVYRGFVQTFCRNLVRGFFDAIENKILNRELGEKKKWQTQSKKDRQDELNKHRFELFVKKALALAAIPVALASGVGFAGLAFTQLLSILPMLGIGAGAVSIIAPWALAVIVGPLYAIVMYGMLYQAIKNNVFLKMKENIVDLFSNKDGKHWAAHAALCALKVAGLVLILAISVAATVFTAGAWLESSVAFFAAAVGLVEAIATRIGIAIGAIFLGTGLWFSIEKSLESTKALMEFSPDAFKKPFSSPGRFFRACVNFIPFVIHVIGTGAVAALGTDIFPPLERAVGLFWTKMIAVLVGTAEEIAVDIKDYSDGHEHGHKHKHEHEHEHKSQGEGKNAKKHGHYHSDIVDDIQDVAIYVRKSAASLGKNIHSFFSHVREETDQPKDNAIRVTIKNV